MYFPGGQKCTYNGKEVDCLTFVSKCGRISSNLIGSTYFISSRVRWPTPMLIIDGHQSRFDPKFIDYINNKGHQWKVCLFVPYATTLWLVSDASELNRMKNERLSGTEKRE